MSKITLTEALAKLKLYDKKIKKQLLGFRNKEQVIDYVVGNDHKCKLSGKEINELKADAQAGIQRIQALMKNRNTLKAAIAQANAVTKITVNGKEYTIVQAIERKQGIENEKMFLDALEEQVAEVQNDVARINSRAQEKANQIIEAQVGSDAKNKKTDEIESLYDLVYNKNRALIVDPINIENLIEAMRDEIESFEQNVDVALSIANAKTEIEVDFDV